MDVGFFLGTEVPSSDPLGNLYLDPAQTLKGNHNTLQSE